MVALKGVNIILLRFPLNVIDHEIKGFRLLEWVVELWKEVWIEKDGSRFGLHHRVLQALFA